MGLFSFGPTKFQLYEASKLRLQIGGWIYGSGGQKRGLSWIQEIGRHLYTDPTSVTLFHYIIQYSQFSGCISLGNNSSSLTHSKYKHFQMLGKVILLQAMLVIYSYFSSFLYFAVSYSELSQVPWIFLLSPPHQKSCCYTSLETNVANNNHTANCIWRWGGVHKI